MQKMQTVINSVDESKFDDLQEAYILFTKTPKFDTSGFPEESKLQAKITQRLEELAQRHFEAEGQVIVTVGELKQDERSSVKTPVLAAHLQPPLPLLGLKKHTSAVSPRKSAM